MSGEVADSGRHGLLGGRVTQHQPVSGFRSGIEPVLLAAAIPARAGANVLEAGSGVGTALLCLSARVPGVLGLGIERDQALVRLASRNAVENGCADLRFLAADFLAWRPAHPLFDHACANPPYHPGSGTGSPDPAREAAKRAAPGLIAAWIAALAQAVRPRGSVTLILPATALTESLAGFRHSGCGTITVFPLWPRLGTPAKLMLVQAVRAGRGPDRIAPGLVLHEGAGYAAAADAVLRDLAPLILRP